MIKEKLRDYRFIEPPEEPNKSYFECANAMYPIDADSEEIFRFFRQNYILPHSNRLEALKHRHRYVIGFQRCSGTKIEQKKCKELPVAMAREFVELCRAQDIAVVNLEPADEHKYLYDNDISGLKLSELYPVMTELDAVVGVDSCFGHAAALLNVPSVTVFVTTYLRFRYIQKFFMPLSRNYSLYPVDYTTVHCEKIFQILMDVLTGRLQLSEEFIPMSQRREYQHYEYV